MWDLISSSTWALWSIVNIKALVQNTSNKKCHSRFSNKTQLTYWKQGSVSTFVRQTTDHARKRRHGGLFSRVQTQPADASSSAFRSATGGWRKSGLCRLDLGSQQPMWRGLLHFCSRNCSPGTLLVHAVAYRHRQTIHIVFSTVLPLRRTHGVKD